MGAGGAVSDGYAREEDDVREGEESEGEPKVEEEVGVEGVAVLGGVAGQVPEVRVGLRGPGLIVVGRLCVADDVQEELMDAQVVAELGMEGGGEEMTVAD